MDIRVLQYFLTIAEEENITRAAEKLNMSQPPLSRQIRQLETELGVMLLERGHRKIQLTEAGYFLKNRSLEILELVTRTKEQIRERCDGASGTIAIGSIETASSSILPILIARYKKSYPKVSFDIWNGNSDDIMERLDKGLIDLGIVRETFNSQRYESIWLPKEPWVVLLHRDTRLGQLPGNEIDLAALAEEPIIIPSATARGEEIRQWFHSVGVTPQVFCVYNAMLSAIMLVREKTGAALCPSSAQNIFSDKAIVCKTIIHPSVASSPVFIWKKYKYLPATVTGFLQSVKKSLQ